MTRDQLLAELLVERFGPIQREYTGETEPAVPAVPAVRLAAEPAVIHDDDEPLEPAFWDARPWTSRDAYADEMFDPIAA